MRKKYSDPLMFSAMLLSGGIDAGASPNSGWGGEEEWDDEDGGNKSASVLMNSSPALQAGESLTIDSNPVEESIISSEAVTGVPSEAGSDPSSALEVAPVINALVPDETAPSGAAE